MQQPTNNPNRKKFLWWGAATVAALSAFRIFRKSKTAPKEEVVKMLTEDGRLVEVIKSRVNPGKKVSNQELQEWVKK